MIGIRDHESQHLKWHVSLLPSTSSQQVVNHSEESKSNDTAAFDSSRLTGEEHCYWREDAQLRACSVLTKEQRARLYEREALAGLARESVSQSVCTGDVGEKEDSSKQTSD